MSEKIQRQVGAFSAVDSSGRAFLIEIHQVVVLKHEADGTTREEPGIKTLRCKGAKVNRISKGEYDIVVGGEFVRVTADAPEAP